ncbi:phage terminase large subunit [Prosthecochloris sp. SCSIO W1102]|uniref:phage terminase large subunit n=1 Tax=Prosthecochloris sp. SCSIO W1102 TaxID=2992243 RepID=UPI00223E2C4D|nr:phage terminase large subunit [Prosthecochloris sp. SCSIO W1102]UZJ40003.1 phage terminase large subunit [Prosthecochloris sp. SCSIO W1102]
MRFAIDKNRMLPHQRQFWELDAYIKLLVGGFGSGKTYIGALRTLWLSYVNRPYPVLYVSPTYPQARRTIVFTIEQMLYRSKVPYSYHKTHHEIRIPGWGGLIWIASGEIPDSLKGPNVAAAGIDEPFIQKKDAFDVVLSRVREGEASHREIFLTGTPEQLNWGYDVAMNDEGKYDLEMVIGKTQDNKHLPAQFIKQLFKAYDENQRAAYMNGMFVNLTKGRVYRYFDRKKHQQSKEIPKDAEVFAGIDFNVDYMTAELFVELDGRTHFFDEIQQGDSDTYQLADRLQEKYPGITVYPDASGKGRRSSAKNTDHMILKDKGFKVVARKQNPAMKDRVNAVNRRIREDRCTFANCPKLIRDMERVVWKNGEIDKTSDPSLSHPSDAAGYAIERLHPVRITKPYEEEQPSAWRV